VLLPFIILGLTSGSVYALGAVGLVLTYKTSRIFNFAYGAIATTGAFCFYALHDQHGVSWPIAAAISVFGVGVVLGVVFEPFARALARVNLALQIAATVGVLLFVEALFTTIYGQDERLFPPFLPTSTFEVGGAHVQYSQLIIVIVGLVATIALYLLLRFARIGVSMRAVVDNSSLLDLSGTSPSRVRRIAWIIGCTFASASGLLLAPSLSLSASTLTLLIVQAFGAAAIGAFSSLPMTYAGGILIGLIAALISKYTLTSSSILLGIPPSTPFIGLFAVLLFMPRKWLAAHPRVIPTTPVWRAPLSVQAVGGIVMVIGLCFVPSLVGVKLTTWTVGLTYVILFLSLGLLVRTSGQVSLSHLSFAAVGAAAFSHLTIGAGIPWLPALLLASLAAVPVGLLLAIPAIRLGGIYLALATFGFGLALQQIFYSSSSLMFGVNGINEPRPSLSWLNVSSTTGYYYVVLGFVVLVALGVVLITRTRLGRILRALSQSPLALETNGTNVDVTRCLVFAISAFIAALAGALLGISTQLADGSLFDPVNSLVLVTLILIVLGGEPWYALMAGAGYEIIPAYIPGGNVPYFFQMFFGATAVMVAVKGNPPVPARVRDFLDRVGRSRKPATSAGASAVGVERPQVTAGSLELRDIEVRFGGLVAVNRLSLAIPTGRITGLIGPNGAGKTTTFNACSGLVRPAEGHVLLDGRDVTKASVSRRARMGLGRTFQQAELFDGLTVAENVAIGHEAALAGANPFKQLISGRGERGQVESSVASAINLCGLREIAGQYAGSLSTGQRRLVELARCLAGPYRILLLDEPSSGLDHRESEHFGEILQRVTTERGVGILLVEHDMALVMRVCQYIHVLDFGSHIFEGAPPDVMASPVVRDAYLGQADDTLVAKAG
jgi:ABC-type branched-subunit amino acid transport system ATPase component/branched-subunit amino acid ABC-type transport system permease component